MCRNAKTIWDIGRKIIGTGDLTIADHDQSSLSKLVEVSPLIPNEIIKSIIFKLIDRSSNLNKTEIKRVIAYWVNIEYLVMSKTFKNNSSQLAYLKLIISNLVG